ncbi:MAG: hypothetical protein IJZ75_06095 [Clostridia bacterium]|nr:hypothetical protein [Clostridia bacterium]
MKRILALLLALCLVMSLAGCGGKKGKYDFKGVDVEYYANLGQLPESEIKLGDDVDTAYADLMAEYAHEETEEEAEHEETFCLSFTEGKYTVISVPTVNYYYVTNEKDEGVSAIAVFEKAYGFELGTVYVEIKEEMEARGFTAELCDLDKNEGFFMPYAEGCKSLTYQFEKAKVIFVFYENALSATAIIKE